MGARRAVHSRIAWSALVALVALASALLLPGTVNAHPLAPMAITATQRGEVLNVTVKRSRVQPRGKVLSPRFPSACNTVATARAPASASETEAFAKESHTLHCPADLAGAEFGVDAFQFTPESQAGVGIERRKRLIEQQELRFGG